MELNERFQIKLETALSQGDLRRVRRILHLQKITRPNDLVFEDGYTLLHLAIAPHVPDEAAPSKTALVKMLIQEYSVDCNKAANNGWRPLHLAAQMNDVHTIVVLADEGKAELNPQDEYGETPLHQAVQKDHSRTANVLVGKYKVDVNTTSNTGDTALHMAARVGSIEIVRILVYDGHADASLKNNAGQTALHLAAREGHPKIVGFLQTVALLNAKEADEVGVSLSRFSGYPLRGFTVCAGRILSHPRSRLQRSSKCDTFFNKRSFGIILEKQG
eukprot:gb/GECG01009448.1/.p1 GENE.gb/GECG01009448.1/~~gb/GECG01009448.1/.p1  ORF type:complete len:274 (+),score=27.81 gb/GECG01009448.1/:1-822(+)